MDTCRADVPLACTRWASQPAVRTALRGAPIIQSRVEDLNPVLRGWANDFRHGASSQKFALVDSYVHMRLSKLASAKYGFETGTGAADSVTPGSPASASIASAGKCATGLRLADLAVPLPRHRVDKPPDRGLLRYYYW